MAGQSNAAPVIIKRKKVVQGGGHHGGAWKVAYADFVTAMMAFFMLMWLLNATTEKQRKGIADYFNPTIPINRASGGGEGALGGDTIFSEETMARSGTGSASEGAGAGVADTRGVQSSSEDLARGQEKVAEDVASALAAKGGESMTMERLMRHVITRVTDQGLIIEIFDLEGAELFAGDTAEPTETLLGIAALLSDVLAITTNRLAVEAHTRAYPITLIEDPTWELSADRAQSMRKALTATGISPPRLSRVVGHADRQPITENPAAIRNNRIEVILLREDR